MHQKPTSYFGYIRVSSGKQEDGVSLKEQRSAIEHYARTHQLQISEWFKETVTAAKQGRPAFTRMLKRLKDGEAAGVLIHKIDRGTRNLKEWTKLGELVDLGVDVRFCHETLDLTTRGGRLAADIQAVVAADFIRNLKQEAKKGIDGRLKQGLYPMRAPLGYVDNGKGKRKTIHPIKGPLVRTAFELYATGRYSLKTLLKELHRRGLRNRNEGRITVSGLSLLLRNPFYIGTIRLRSTGAVYPGVHKPLIPPLLFRQVQEVLKGKVATRGRKHDFLYRRLFTCELCGRALIGELQKGHVYYRCHTCSQPPTNIREDEIDALVRRSFEPIELTDEEHTEFLREFERQIGAIEDIQQEVDRNAQLQMEAIQTRLDRLTDVYVDGGLDADAFNHRRAKLLEELQEYKFKLEKRRVNSDEIYRRGSEFLELTKSLYSSYIISETIEKRDFLKIATSNRMGRAKKPVFKLQNPYFALSNRPSLTKGAPNRNANRTFAHQFIRYIIKLYE